MTYKETLTWMFQQLPMYQQKGTVALKEKLDNIIVLTERLGNPHENFKSIHVAGTNGKGSSSHMLASVLQEAGYKVGLYTSPHLKDFRERIRINGETIDKKAVKQFIASHKYFLEQNQLSFFEMTVGMAFEFFAKEKVDIAIIEVGLGGRLDSTNIIAPEVSLITNIGLDHTQILGDTIEKIALEKAGIIKRNTPVVISEKQAETTGIFSLIAAKNKAEITFADDQDIPHYKTDLIGTYQIKNIRGVVCTLKQLNGFDIKNKHLRNGLKNVAGNTGLLGRWQVLGKEPLIVCDTAHNREGLQLVLKQVSEQKFNRLHLVLGFVNDKNLYTILELFPSNASYYFVTPNIPRGLAAGELKKVASKYELVGTEYATVSKGLEAALKEAQKDDMVYVGGSTFVVAEVV
ncbi:bifunctional folylpolyglutamate synthase/dihydrofolate synthase [Muricauda sp. 2012CJ35-5]|uniref:Dihydrofolate synthase/folylpolyglutamate synthase n=1 Tax=Flagellimonas spongiicola TaxID=2942208 RepID=A0ABT0PLV2_9FLAO|nr:folylpolyglutamate synthase/dihydrofolate synthase family protein [Allomuricauda spongiicola]MCL6272374.1 bifunctional folylpolyglutamate synthase/dihydrofolate synthase [Allomuricauda spongiicola]